MIWYWTKDQPWENTMILVVFQHHGCWYIHILKIDINKFSNVFLGWKKNMVQNLWSRFESNRWNNGVWHSYVSYRLEIDSIPSILPNKQQQDHLNHVAWNLFWDLNTHTLSLKLTLWLVQMMRSFSGVLFVLVSVSHPSFESQPTAPTHELGKKTSAA